MRHNAIKCRTFLKIELEKNEETPSIEATAALEKVSEKFSTNEETQKVEETKKVEEAPKEIVVEKIEEIKPAPIVNTKIEKEEEVENDTVVLFEQAPIKREGHLFVFLVDVSESMDKPFRMGLLKVVLDSFFRNLQPNDEVSIVTFNYASKTILPITSASESSLIIKKINDTKIQIDYFSSRAGLLPFVEGLLSGLGTYYNQKFSLTHIPKSENPLPSERMQLEFI